MQMSRTMVRLMTFSGLVAAMALAAVLLAASSQSGKVQAAEDNGNCRTIQVAVDDGYGVSGTVSRKVCD
jgi:hypothetical protein